MYVAYLVVTILTAVANLAAAALDFARSERITTSMDAAGVPRSWLTPLGILKTAGALGLLVGIAVPPIGVAAAIGLVAFFVGAVIIHLRVRDYSLGPQYLFLPLAVASLVLRLLV